jgi:hypothetical protein
MTRAEQRLGMGPRGAEDGVPPVHSTTDLITPTPADPSPIECESPWLAKLYVVLQSLLQTLTRLANALERPPIDRLVTRKDFASIIRASLPLFDRLRSAGRLPRPDLYLGRAPRWRAETVRSFLEKTGGRT